MTAHTKRSKAATKLPIYHHALDWDAFYGEYPVPDVYEQTVYRWTPKEIRQYQNRKFLELVAHGWTNDFYRERWSAAGLKPGDIKSLDDITRLPMFNSDDIKTNQQAHPPFGTFHGPGLKYLETTPLKMQTSGGTTGKPRPTLFGPVEWEINGLSMARALYIQGGRPGDVCQIPATCSLANLGWCIYTACQNYLGILPLTTGSGVVTASRRQMEIAHDFGTNVWLSFPEYMTQLAKVYRDDFGQDVRDLKTKLITSFLGPDTEDTLRRQVEDLWGCDVYDNYGTHEIGLGAFECKEKDGLHFMEDTLFFEVVDTETGQPVPDCEPGNLVVTVLHRKIPPVIRFNLRDLARIKYTDQCKCGSHFRRMDKFLGRSDDMVKLRGVNVYPMGCLPAIKSDPRTTGEWVCIVERFERDGVIRDEMTVRVEVSKTAGSQDGLKEMLEKRLQNDLGVKVAVELAAEGQLAEIANLGREGKPKRLVDRRNVKK